jgi:ELWxxDGT repeat protein
MKYVPKFLYLPYSVLFFFLASASVEILHAQTFTLVKDIRPGAATSAPDELVTFNGKLYFRANNGTNGNELHVSDGTEANTFMVKDIRAGSAGGSVALLSVLNNQLSFFANDGTNGTELFNSDGTEPGTNLVIDLNPGPASSVGGFYATLGGFKYWDGTVNDLNGPVTELWRTDGTAAGTTLVKAIRVVGTGGSSPRSITTIGNQVFFFADDGVNGYELWKSDGTAAGTVLTKDINPGNMPSSPEGSEIFEFNNVAYFRKSNGVTGVELWRSDGTEAGTFIVKDINSGAGDSNPFNFIVYNNHLYFIANDGTSNKLWKTDGTAAGTVSLTEAGGTFTPGGLKSMVVFQNQLYFPGTDITNGTELWKTDGTPGGTILVKDINPGSVSSNLANFINTGNKIVFQATTAAAGAEPWSSDGSLSGTALLQDIEPGTGSSLVEKFTIAGTQLFALATTSAYGREVWVINNFVTLPLRFLSFSAQKCNTGNVCLNWKTANEVNVSHFDIERSIDGTLFQPVKQVPAQNQAENGYQYTDNISSLEHKTQIYYRIKQVDKDGKSSYSRTERIGQTERQVTVYPALFSDGFRLSNNVCAGAELLLYNTDGRLIHRQKLVTGNNEVIPGAAGKGVILYQVVCNGQPIKQGKLVRL